MKCSKVFLDWMSLQIWSDKQFKAMELPSKEINESEKNLYLLNGFAQLKTLYINDTPANLPKMLLEPWTHAVINKYIRKIKKRDWSSISYGIESGLVFYFL